MCNGLSFYKVSLLPRDKTCCCCAAIVTATCFFLSLTISMSTSRGPRCRSRGASASGVGLGPPSVSVSAPYSVVSSSSAAPSSCVASSGGPMVSPKVIRSLRATFWRIYARNSNQSSRTVTLGARSPTRFCFSCTCVSCVLSVLGLGSGVTCCWWSIASFMVYLVRWLCC